MKLLPLGGLGEIGMNCMLLESDEEILVIDCGLMFSDLDHFGVEFIIPDFTYLKERKDKVKGFLITHGHEDHIGALPFALKLGINAPIYASQFSSLLIREKLKEHTLDKTVELRSFNAGDRFQVGSFKIEAASVNHSIVDAMALIIDTPLGKIIHTGDFKMDSSPFYGSPIDMEPFKRAAEEGVYLLLSDSTNVERCEHSLSESIVYQKFEELFAAAHGLTIVSMFASNVGRIGQVFTLAKKMDKKVALSGRSMEQNLRLGMEAGYLKDALSSLISLDDIDQYPRDQVIVVSTGSQGEYRSSLIRVANGEHSQIQLQEGDLVLMSSKFIPGNEKAIGKMINNLFKQGAHVVYEAVNDIHVSGHATRPELEKMLRAVKPKFFIPVHGEYRHLVHHSALAKEVGIPPEHVLLAVNGDTIQLTPEKIEVIDHIEEPRVLVEGRDGQDISKLVLRDRRRMGEGGVVFALMVQSSVDRKIISGPEVILKGLVSETQEADFVAGAKKVATRVIADYEAQLEKRGPAMDLQETVRIELRRYFNSRLGKKPTVLPIILEM